MFRFWSYLRFLFRSTNQHGVHSPFVFGYLTRCLYQKGTAQKKRSHKIVLRSIPYFDLRSIAILGEDHDLSSLLRKTYPELTFDRPPYDLVLIREEMLCRIDLTAILSDCHNDSMILLEGIRRTRKARLVWESLSGDPRITVSIDYFFGGLLFPREEQAKQHFRIRI